LSQIIELGAETKDTRQQALDAYGLRLQERSLCPGLGRLQAANQLIGIDGARTLARLPGAAYDAHELAGAGHVVMRIARVSIVADGRRYGSRLCAVSNAEQY